MASCSLRDYQLLLLLICLLSVIIVSIGWRSCKPTSSSSGALDSLAAVLKTLGVKDTEMEPPDLGSGTGLSNISFFLPKMMMSINY